MIEGKGIFFKCVHQNFQTNLKVMTSVLEDKWFTTVVNNG